jgi:hypothetical protein
MRTDGRHNVNANPADVMALSYHCRDCGLDFSGDQLYVWDLQLQGGRPSRLLSVDGRTTVSEDDLRCACDSRDIYVTGA